MNKDDLIKKLESLDLPEIELQNHRRRLKTALLNSGYWKGESTIMSLLKKQIVPVSGIIAIAAIIIVFSFVFKSATLPVSAQEIAQKSYNKVTNLSPEQEEELNKTTGALDARDLLEEALSAEDLKVLTYDEFAGQYPPAPPDPEGKLHTLTFLKFTHSNGMTVILGIDQNFLPAFCTAMMFGPDRGEGENAPGPGEHGFSVGSEGANEGASTVEVIDGERFINGVKVTSQE